MAALDGDETDLQSRHDSPCADRVDA
jgi:hypothetical protein